MKDLVRTVMDKSLSVVIFALRVAAVGLFYAGIHWLAWHYLGPRHAWMVDVWLAGGTIVGLAIVALHRWAPRHAETGGQLIAFLVGGVGFAVVPGEVARSLSHAALVRAIDILCGLFAVLVVAAGLWEILRPKNRMSSGGDGDAA